MKPRFRNCPPPTFRILFRRSISLSPSCRRGPITAFVSTSTRKLQQPDELSTVCLFQEKTSSAVYTTILAVKQHAFTLDVLAGRVQSSGSGFIWDKDGHIATHYHVIHGASEVRPDVGDKSSLVHRASSCY